MEFVVLLFHVAFLLILKWDITFDIDSFLFESFSLFFVVFCFFYFDVGVTLSGKGD